ncbi:hypothetical protein M8494_02345 [Serratia ureilytica]
MFIINSEGNAIPLSTSPVGGRRNAPLSGQPSGLSAASTISFNLPDGGCLSGRHRRGRTHHDSARRVPSTVRGAFASTARVFEDTLKSQLI